MNAKQTESPKPKRGAPKKKITKIRTNISINPAVLKSAQKLAFAGGVSLSTWLEQLVRGKLEGDQ